MREGERETATLQGNIQLAVPASEMLMKMTMTLTPMSSVMMFSTTGIHYSTPILLQLHAQTEMSFGRVTKRFDYASAGQLTMMPWLHSLPHTIVRPSTKFPQPFNNSKNRNRSRNKPWGFQISLLMKPNYNKAPNRSPDNLVRARNRRDDRSNRL